VNPHVGRLEALSRRDNPTIARRFSAGSRPPRSPRPEGTPQARSHKTTDSAVPSGRMQHQTAFPALKRRAIVAMSLRDNNLPQAAWRFEMRLCV